MDSLPDTIVERRLDLTWRMLAALGAPVAASPLTGVPVDPECALLLACRSAKEDTRAAELAVWLAARARRVLAVGRTLTIAMRAGDRAVEDFQAFGATVQALGVTRGWPGVIVQEAVPWRVDIDPSRLDERIGASDLAPKALTTSATHGVRLRLAFGLTSRADALAYLIGTSAERGRREWIGLAALDETTGWGRRSLLAALTDMASSGLVGHRRQGRSHQFAAEPGLLPELGPPPDNWISWPPRLVALFAFEEAARSVAIEPTMTSVMQQRSQLVERLPASEPAFNLAGDPNTMVERFLRWCDSRAARCVADLDQ